METSSHNNSNTNLDGPELVKKFTFDEAGNYNSYSLLELEDGLKLIELLAPGKGNRVLDLGCGTGSLSKVLAEYVGLDGKVVAIDPDLSRLEVAKNNCHASNLEFMEGTAENIPGTEYDIVFSNHVLHWCKDKSKGFFHIANCLKPGGKFGFQCIITDQFNMEFLLLSSRMQKVLSDKLSNLNISELDHYAANNHLKEVYRDKHECKHTFESVAEYKKFFHVHTLQREVSMDFVDTTDNYQQNHQEVLSFEYLVVTSIMVKE